jgi:heme/copper-type cytochrome/quinol oxidase subunit 4
MYEYFKENLFKSLRRCRKYFSISYEWNNKTSQISLIQDQQYRKIFRMLTCFHYLYIILTAIAFLLVIRYESSLVLKILSIGVVSLASIVIWIGYMHSSCLHDIVQFLNAMITFQRVDVDFGKQREYFYTFLNNYLIGGVYNIIQGGYLTATGIELVG